MQTMVFLWLFVLFFGGEFSKCSAAPGVPRCDGQALLPCLMPTVTFFVSSEGQDIAKLKEGHEITETQLTSICRLSRTTVTCLQNHIEQCFSDAVPELRDFMRGTSQLLQVCDSPRLYSSAKILMACNQKLSNNSDHFRNCTHSLSQVVKSATPVPTGLASSMSAQSPYHNLLSNFCCEMQKLRTCLGTEVKDQCGTEADALDDTVFSSIMSAYSCAARTAQCEKPHVQV